MGSSWNTCGPDTAHITYREGGGRTPQELCALLAEFQRMHDLPTNPLLRDKGLSGFDSAAVDKAAGLRLDWTRPNGEGANAGFFCLQVKGAWFEAADGEVQADFLQLLEAYGIYRVTRLDLQQTTRTNKFLTPWFIDQFESGNLRVVGRKHYEPRGAKDHLGEYPRGATLYHGSRTSERFARQYDKHLQAQFGPPRRRDEVEIKGETSRNLWADLQQALVTAEQQGVTRGATLHAFSKGAIRAFLPIRDTSRWAGQELPRKWTEMAKEPTTWATLFDDEPITVKPRERRVSSLLKSYRYAMDNFGAAMSCMWVQRAAQAEQRGHEGMSAWQAATYEMLTDAIENANEDRVRDFFAEMPPSEALKAHQYWLSAKEDLAAWREVQENNPM